MAKFTQGIYKPINKKKFIGDVNNIIYRSSWELSLLFQYDTDPNIVEIGSEEVIIPYRDINNKIRRYFVDFIVKRKVNDKIVTELIEVKPFKETIPPVLTEGKKMKTKIREALVWDINQRKWAAARKYCEMKGWVFKIITEKQLPGMKKF